MYIVLPLICIFSMIIIIYYSVNKFGLKIRLNLLLICGFLGMFFGLVMPKILLPQLSFTGTALLVLFLMFILSAFLAWFFGMEETQKDAIVEYIDINSDMQELSFAFNSTVDNDKVVELTEETMYIKNYYPEQEFFEEKTFACADAFDMETLNSANFDVTKYEIEQNFNFIKSTKKIRPEIDTQEFLSQNPLISSYKDDYVEQIIIKPLEDTLLSCNEQELALPKTIENNFSFEHCDQTEIVYVDTQFNSSIENYFGATIDFEQTDYIKDKQIPAKSSLLYTDEHIEANKLLESSSLQLKEDTLNVLSEQEYIQTADKDFFYSIEDSTKNTHTDLLDTDNINNAILNENSEDKTAFEQSIEQFIQENNANSIDKKLSDSLENENAAVKNEFYSYFSRHCEDEDLPYQRFTDDKKDTEKTETNMQFPLSDSIDDLLDFAFNQKEQGNYKAALSIFEIAYNMYCDISNIAILLNIEIANTYKQLGQYDEAIAYLESAIVKSDSDSIKQDFTINIAYFNIIKNVLKSNDLKFLPYSQIPVKVKEDIEKEFLQYKKQINS